MALGAPFSDGERTTALTHQPQLDAAAARERLDDQLSVSAAFETRGIDIGTFSVNELSELEAMIAERVRPVLDDVVVDWRQERGVVGEQERLRRELRRRIVDEKEPLGCFECEACSFRDFDHHAFVMFRGLSLCDGCFEHARDVLRDLQRPLVEALQAEPTIANARALGFELARRSDGRLLWVSEDEDFDSGEEAYADEREALECLADELG